MELSDILVALIGGTLVGLVGKWFVPAGKENVPLWLTIVCGIAGVLIGTFLYGLVYDPTTPGIDWWRHVWQVAVAVAFVIATASFLGRRRA
jgi:uncharacterized membrane protein YeaQ/YmgE (transglycosylase-associated protein family)